MLTDFSDRIIEGIGDSPPVARLIYGHHVVDALRTLRDESVHVVCTSPPYWGLRDYGTVPCHWPEIRFVPVSGLPAQIVPEQDVSLGSETDPWHFVGHLVHVFRETRRVLRADGTLWLNLGDSYTTGIGQKLKPKDLSGIPWRVAMALQADGWWLRNDIIWEKRSVMPESVKDRCTRSHEYVFLLTKQERYHYDAETVRVPASACPTSRARRDRKDNGTVGHKGIVGYKFGQSGKGRNADTRTGTRNLRTVWTVDTQPYPGAHFACFPPKLVEPMILAGTSEKGCCSSCGTPVTRSTERHGVTVGWRPSCDCAPSTYARCVVFDPFSGSATTGKVALDLGRNYIGIDLNEQYLPLAEARLRGCPPPSGDPEEDEESVLDLFRAS